MMNKSRILPTIASVLVLTTALDAGEWANWRGPNGLGISDETNLPVKWDTQTNVAWKSTLPGQGTSSPVVFQDRVFITTQTEDDSLHVLAIHAQKGEILWNTKVGQGKLPAHNLHNMATPTPVADGQHVWAHFGTGDLVCLNSDGTIVWQRNLVQDYGAYRSNHGMGNSPLIVDGKLLIACMHQGPSYLLAVDPLTGKNIWKTERNLDSKEEAMDSYSSPIVAHLDNQKLVILSGADHLDAYDPSTGSQIWISSGLQVPHPYGRSISGPAFGENTVITVASGFRNQGFVMAVNPNGTGDISASGNCGSPKDSHPIAHPH
ncbi:MAG: PQQ-like beta-propeller repeat protein [Verrucomicrobia bacterium]|nr:PQQ-like beta-propeller repeat protein [Verrucomicrobiota bacterium]